MCDSGRKKDLEMLMFDDDDAKKGYVGNLLIRRLLAGFSLLLFPFP